MNITGNTILITGGGSGIGRGLAEALAKEGNQIIISGRRLGALSEVTSLNAKIEGVSLDIDNADSIGELAGRLTRDFPKLNVVIHNAGIARPENLQTQSPDVADAVAIVTTNLLGPIRLHAALMPHLRKQPHATIITVTSGLAFVPLAMMPTYCATKAAIHSWTLSLRWQLKGTNIEVKELIPPYVQTHLGGPQQAADPRAMPLADYISEVMQILKREPNAREICVERVKPLRFSAESGKLAETFQGLNQAMPLPV